MADDIAQWLERLGLGQYVRAFAANDVDLRTLPHLSDDDLTALGLSLGHRRLILGTLKEQSEPTGTDGAGATSSSEGTETTAPAEAERRQLTVMFCDLVGSTALSSNLDPEDMRDVIRSYQDACAGVVTRFGGYLAKYMGDGVLVYFGYPSAHEDDAERAINAGLGVVEAVAALPRDLAVRVGIATGTVVVGDIVGEGAAREAAITGETPNLAARLQEIAERDAVVVASTTYALAGRMFTWEDFGRRELKGFPEPVQVWRVTGAARAESRFDATRAADLTEMIGRDEEIEILTRRWHRAGAGEGQVVLVSGEPGIGKSRLVRELQDRIAETPHYRLRYQCSPFHATSPLHPVIERLERTAGFEPGDTPAAKLDKLDRLVRSSERPREDVVALLAALLTVPADARYTLPEVSPQRLKELTLAALDDQLAALSRDRPVLFVVEDAHWIDPTTLELIELTVERAAELRLLVVITHRPEFEAPWLGRPRVTSMLLARLDGAASARMVERVAGAAALPAELQARIADRTDGVPLFVEELTRAVLESAGGAGAREAIEVPATLQDSLEARLDRLGAAKELAQIGAVHGREFPHAMLAAIAGWPDAKLDEALESLVDSGLVIRRGAGDAATYAFKHALIHDTAYGSLLRARRGALHGAIAAWLDDHMPDVAETEPERMAHHLAQAGEAGRAIEMWQRASRIAVGRAAYQEGLDHLNRGLEQLPELPESTERLRIELELHSAAGPLIQTIFGWGSDEAIECYDLAEQLCRQLGDDEKLFPVLWGYWALFRGRQQPAKAREIVDELFRLARERDDEVMMLEAHHAAWGQPFKGDFTNQLQHIEQALRIYDPDEHTDLAMKYGNHDVGVCGLLHQGVVLWSMGFPDQARRSMAKGKDLALKISHPPTSIQVQHISGLLFFLAGDVSTAYHESSQSIERSRELGLFNFVPISLSLQGWARGMAEGGDDAIADLARTVEFQLDSKRPAGLVATSHAMYAEVVGRKRSVEEGLELIEQSLVMIEEHEERLWKANTYTLRGEFLRELGGDRSDEAEAAFREAIAVARDQDARMWELRAATHLGGLMRDQGRADEARELLAPLHGWFTEGFDTADLKAAKALLDELI